MANGKHSEIHCNFRTGKALPRLIQIHKSKRKKNRSGAKYSYWEITNEMICINGGKEDAWLETSKNQV